MTFLVNLQKVTVIIQISCGSLKVFLRKGREITVFDEINLVVTNSPPAGHIFSHLPRWPFEINNDH